LVDKPVGVTSAGVIRRVKGPLGRAKIGHVGTLDPFASGLLPLCVGEATKIAAQLLLEHKAYEGRIRLGEATDTLDATGAIVDQATVPALTPDAVEAMGRRFLGAQLQVPPMYSALKRDGVPLYRLAREGVEVERAPREVMIERLVLRLEGPARITFEVACSKGTYVRVLAADIGRALGTVAHLESLRRTGVGRFRVADAVVPETLLERSVADWPWIPIAEALRELPQFALDAAAVQTLRRGQQEPLARLPRGRPEDTALLVGCDGEAVGVVRMEVGYQGWRIVRLLGA
jgi:tRNA pseudouridine55 synthase